MACNIASTLSFLLTVLLLSSCMISMHACDARLLGIPGLFEDQELLGRRSESGIEVNVEGEVRDSLLGSEVVKPEEDSSTGNEAIVSPSSQINSRAIEWKATRRQVGEVMTLTEPGSLDGTVDDNAVDSVDSDVGEDTVVMDYAQPHRKPPIHNEKP